MPTRIVGTQAELNAAILQTRGGDTILLKPGTYAKLELNVLSAQHKHIGFASKVTIASADPTKPAIVQELTINGASNVAIRGLTFDNVGRSETPFNIGSSKGISITNSVFDGHIAKDGFGAGYALRVRDSADIALEGNKVANFYNGFTASRVEKLKFSANSFTGIKNDAMAMGGIKGAELTNNHFSKFKSPASLSHKDGIQFRAIPSEGSSSDVVIRGNTFIDHEARHAIFIGNEFARDGDSSKPYKNFLIEKNTIVGGHAHGIGIAHVDGLVIRDNTLSQHSGLDPKAHVAIPIINVGKSSANVTITGNKAPSVPQAVDKSWLVEGNQTSGGRLKHWDGYKVEKKLSGPASELYKSWLKSSSQDGAKPVPGQPDAPKTVELSGTKGKADSFALNGSKATGDRKVTIEKFDFKDGDVFIFRDYDSGTFRSKPGGNVVHNSKDGVYFRADSVLDLQEVARMSPKVAAKTEGADVLFRVEHAKGVDEILFKGWASAFKAADLPDLF